LYSTEFADTVYDHCLWPVTHRKVGHVGTVHYFTIPSWNAYYRDTDSKHQ